MPLATTFSVDELRAAVTGRVVAPGDADYDAIRRIFYGVIDPHPGAIVLVAGAEDIARVIRFARATGTELAVRSGGHSGAGHSSTDGGIVIDLRERKQLDVDATAKTAWAEAGLTAGEVSTALAEHGLAVGFGDTGSVGIGGITLGGGVGYLVRKHGLTIDNLLAVELVTADGDVLHVDAANHPDLFWALRGGGGNFGVVTRFQFRLHELAGIVGGMLVLPATTETIAGFIAAAEAAPEEVSTIANVMTAPPMPFLPEDVVGTPVIMGMLAYAGSEAAGHAALAPFRALATPLADFVRPMAYPELFPPEDESYRPKAESRTMFIDHVDAATATTILESLNASDAPMRVAQLRVLGGASARVPAEATAYAHRASRIMVNVAAFFSGPEDQPIRRRWVEDFAAALDQGDPAAYVNFVGDEGEAGVRAAYPAATYRRLAEIKRRYDPDNVFRRNQNVRPAPA